MSLRGDARDAAVESRTRFGGGTNFFVDSTLTAAGDGSEPAGALATVGAAVALCTHDKGDVINIASGHAQTIVAAGGIDINVRGVIVQGLGVGSIRPTFTLGTATTATFVVSAINVTVRNIRFVGNIDDLAAFLDLTAGNTTFEDCEFVTSSTKEALCFAKMTTTKDEFTFRRCRFVQPTDPAGTDGAAGTGCFYLVDTEGLYIEDCEFYGNFETAIVHNKTTAAKRVWMRRCFGYQLLTGAEVFTQVTAMEGGVQHTMIILPGADDVTEAKTWGTMSDKFFIDVNSCVGNDGAGGQLAVAGASAAT